MAIWSFWLKLTGLSITFGIVCRRLPMPGLFIARNRFRPPRTNAGERVVYELSTSTRTFGCAKSRSKACMRVRHAGVARR